MCFLNKSYTWSSRPTSVTQMTYSSPVKLKQSNVKDVGLNEGHNTFDLDFKDVTVKPLYTESEVVCYTDPSVSNNSFCSLQSNKEARYKEDEFCSVRLWWRCGFSLQKSFGTNSSEFRRRPRTVSPLSLSEGTTLENHGRKSSVHGEKWTRARGQKCPSLSPKLRWPEQESD